MLLKLLGIERKQIYLVPIFVSPQNASFPPQDNPDEHLSENSELCDNLGALVSETPGADNMTKSPELARGATFKLVIIAIHSVTDTA